VGWWGVLLEERRDEWMRAEVCNIFSDVDCYNLQIESSNCGKCSNSCPDESPFCVNGACNPCTDAGYTLCGDYGCVDLDTNDAFCGSCSTSCPLLQTCSGGSCVG